MEEGECQETNTFEPQTQEERRPHRTMKGRPHPHSGVQGRAVFFANTLALRLAVAEMSNNELAKLVGVSHGTINRYVAGETVPTLTILYRIAAALDCDPAELIWTPKEDKP